MNIFRVGLTNTSGEDHVIAVLNSLGEARSLVDAIEDFKPWIEWAQMPGVKLIADEGGITWRRATFTPEEKRNIESVYLMARSELRIAGMAAERIDRLLPLTADGSVPWE